MDKDEIPLSGEYSDSQKPVLLGEPTQSITNSVRSLVAENMSRIRPKSEVEKEDIVELENAIEKNEFGSIIKKVHVETGKLSDEYRNKVGFGNGYLPPECYTRFVIVRLSKLTPRKFLKLLYESNGFEESFSGFLDTDFSYGINENLKLLPQEILKKYPDFKKPRKRDDVILELRTMISKREINKNGGLQRFLLDNFSGFLGKE